MNNRRLVLALVAIGLFFVSVLVWYKARPVAPALNVPVSQKLVVKQIRVITGHEFDITFDGGKRMNCQLMVVTPTGQGSNVAKKVTDLINSSTNPRVVLLKKEGIVQKIELYLTPKGGKEIALSEWLKQNKMVWD